MIRNSAIDGPRIYRETPKVEKPHQECFLVSLIKSVFSPLTSIFNRIFQKKQAAPAPKPLTDDEKKIISLKSDLVEDLERLKVLVKYLSDNPDILVKEREFLALTKNLTPSVCSARHAVFTRLKNEEGKNYFNITNSDVLPMFQACLTAAKMAKSYK